MSARFALLLTFLTVAGCGAETDRPRWCLERLETKQPISADNLGAVSWAVADRRLYLGTWNTATGGEVFRSRDGRHWSRVGSGGLGRRRSFCVISLAVFRGHLHAGTWNVEEGAGLHRARLDDGDQLRWQSVTVDGFGDPCNQAVTGLCAFRDHLYAGCYNPAEGAEVWRSPTGQPGSWRQVNANAFGDARNSDATSLRVHGDHLYVSTEALRIPGRGCQIWRTDGRPAATGLAWERVADNGFGNPENVNVWGMTVFRGMMYAATWNPEQGAEVWRARPDPDRAPWSWERVAAGGFGDRDYYMATSLVALGDTLFLGAVGKHRYRGNPFEGGAEVIEAAGGVLMSSRDGCRWTRIDRPGFLRSPVLGAASLAVFDRRLFIGATALDRPLEIWTCRPRTDRAPPPP